MRASYLGILSLSPLALAAPINLVRRDLSSLADNLGLPVAGLAADVTPDAVTFATEVVTPATSLAGATSTVFGFAGDATSTVVGVATDVATPAARIAVPNAAAALASARQQVVAGLNDTAIALSTVSAQANATGNTDVGTLVTAAQSGLNAAVSGVTNIGAAIASGATPSRTDQKDVAEGIFAAEAAINNMTSAITTPDAALSSDIASASTSVEFLKAGALAVLSASNITLTDLGLPANAANN